MMISQELRTEQKQESKQALRGRVEDFRFLVGRGRYIDDMNPGNVAYLGIVRSGYAHAKIKNIDLSGAKNHPDFVDAITGEDLVKIGAGTVAETPLPGVKITGRLHLAFGKVRYIGEPVVAFVSRRKYSVEDIAELVNIEYDEQLPVISTIQESKNKKSLVYENWDSNRLVEYSVKKGDVASAQSAFTIKKHLGIRRQAGAPIEPRVVIASYDKNSEIYHIYSTVQGAHRLRLYLTNELKVPPEKIHVTVPDVGGGFGVKGAQSYCENMLSCILAKRTGMTIKWTSTRTEDMLETSQSRDEYCDIELSCNADGILTALKATIESDGGVGGTMKGMPGLTTRLLPGAYKIPNIEINAGMYATNKTMTGPMRGAGRPEASFFIELAMDALAKETKIDPYEFRFKNIIKHDEFPYANGAGMNYDSANLEKLLDMIRDEYAAARRWKSDHDRRDNPTQKAGVGLALIVEDTGSQLSETSKLTASYKDKKIILFTGSSPHGQGHETTWAILASEELGIPLDQISVAWGDTNELKSSIGTFGSRSAVTGGSAVVEGCRKLKNQLVAEAAGAFSLNPEELEFRNGAIYKKGSDELVSGLWKLIEKLARDVEVNADFTAKDLTFASGVHLCRVLVDAETGKLKIEKYTAIDDCGRVINEMIVEGQLQGGIAHGLSGSFLEQIEYNEDATPLAQNFMDYTMATALDIPELDLSHIETRSTISLNGAKGVGESGTIGAYPAVFNALNNALENIGNLTIAPATPDRVLRAISPNLFSK